MRKLMIAAITVLSISTYAIAAERKLLMNVDTDELSTDTQVSAEGAGDTHFAMIWWIPTEFWDATLSREAVLTEAQKNYFLDTMSNISLLATIQADITELAAFHYYLKEEVEEKMFITFTDTTGRRKRLLPMTSVTEDQEVVLGIFKPILEAAMGNLGKNMHFFVLNDKSNSSHRIIDPYRTGYLSVQLSKRNGDLITAGIEMPLNALFVPRKCPNGKSAHVSWKYCPWSGKRLNE